MPHTTTTDVPLAYDEAGTGGPAVLLLHGMRCHRGHMAPLYSHLSRRHRVVSLDLRGHGESSVPDGPYTNEAIAADVVAVCDELSLDRPLVIGHSFGGSVALFAAVRRPDRFGGLVLLDSGIRSAAAKDAELGHIADAATDADDASDWLRSRLFGPDDDPVVVDEILAVMDAMPESVSLRLGEAVVGYDAEADAVDCTAPGLMVLADRPFTTEATLSRLGANWRVGRVVGAGHFVQLFAPEQVAAMVDRFVELVWPPVGAATH